MALHLVLGGARSGKSAYAQRQAAASGLIVTVIVTALPLDDEMRTRIRLHREQRPAQWRTVEAPIDLAAALLQETADDRFLIVDCLTLWAANLLCPPASEPDRPTLGRWKRAREALLQTIPRLRGQVSMVSNEIGWGVVPLGATTRHFVDEVGRLNQEIAQCADAVTLVMAGIPLRLKGRQ